MRRYQLALLLLSLIILGTFAAETIKTENDPKKDKAKVLQERAKNKRMLEACLTLVRSLYTMEEKNIQDFVMKHPSTTKERLINKILSHMMIHCREKINDEQVTELMKFRDYASDFDSSKPEYANLLNFDLNRYKVDETASKEVQEAPIEMTQAEITMQTIVEDLSEEMKREREEELKTGRNAPSIFFFELSSMSTTMGLVYVVSIIGIFGLIFYVLATKIISKPVDFTKQKKLERMQKKSSNKSGNSGTKKTN